MLSRVDATVLVAAVLLGVTGCHKQAPPATDVKPVAATPSPTAGGPNTGMSPGGSARPNTGSDDPSRRNAEAATLSVMIHFDYNEAVLRPEDKRILDAKASVLQANPGVHLRIVGNCDERGSDEYNIALGMRRAAAARDYLAIAGIAASRIDVSSLGREKLIDGSNTPDAWARNRRDEFNVTAGVLQ